MSSIQASVKTPLQILDQGKHHLVVFKPSNMVVVTGRGAPKPTLLDVAIAEFGKGIRPVHRLDRGTTGCCILAKDLFGQQALSNAFRKHLVNKTYLAIIEGVPDFKKLSVDARLKRVDTPNNKKSLAHQTIAEDGERALTHLKVLSTTDGLTLIEARPVTGRMHQIRAHLSHLGFPIIGDILYGSKRDYAPHSLALHAYSVDFPVPEGGRKKIVAEPDERFAALAKLP
ncbi:MAG: RNA pseudouridine synthase [Myxococcota bacterium]